MNKVLCLLFAGVALMVQPVIGSDTQVRAAAGERWSRSSDATALIPDKVKRALASVRAAPTQSTEAMHSARSNSPAQSLHLAAISNALGASEPGGAPQTSPPRDESDLKDWTLLPAALLVIAFIIRRRTAVR